MGLTATRSRNSVVVPVVISVVGPKVSCGRHDVVKLVAADLKPMVVGASIQVEDLNTKYSIKIT
jgi:hypothetical protein